jgi:predicted TIM-barrel fold metal-dependent hydrolase
VLDHPVISADGHLDLPLLPHDLFTSRAPASMRDRVPHVVDGPDGTPIWVWGDDARQLARVGGSAHTGQAYSKGQSARFDRMNESGFWDDIAKGIMHPTDPALRLGTQDRDGIVGEVLYGILGAADSIDDPDIQSATMRAYNEWLAEFCSFAPGRLVGVACLPSRQPEAAADELRRCVSTGLPAVEVAMRHDLEPLWDDRFTPIWQAADECGAIVHLHTIGPPIAPTGTTPRQRAAWLGTWLTVFQLRMIERLAELVFGGVLHAYPNLRIVLGESGIGWLPYVLDRMDEEWHERLTHLELTMPPSDYYRRQMFATFQHDEAGLLLAERIGVHTLMWGNDFPHGDGVWPDSIEVIEKQFAEVPASVRRAICFDNAAALYGLGG